jgi:biopolymer transport protein ExbD
MKMIKFIALWVFVCLAASCSSLNPMQEAFKQPNYPFANVPKNIEHAKPDAHAFDEKALIVSVRYPNDLYVGAEQYPRYVVGEILEKRLRENPSEKQLIYLNADFSTDYGNIVEVLDIIRRQDVENVGLLVEPASGADKKLQVLKIKLSAEPKDTDAPDMLDRRLVINLQKDNKIKLGRYEKYVFKPAAPEIKEEEVSGKLAQMFKENEEKKITLKGANEIDKTVFIKATRANRYAEVARLIAAAAAAAASEVYLMLDDLE